MQKTNATRILDKMGIEYEVLEYDVDEDQLGAEHVAEELGISADMTMKTLVVKGDRSGVFVCCLSGDHEIDMKLLESITGDRNIETVPASMLLSLTGYVRGGVSPLGMKKSYRILKDSHAISKEKVSMSAGKRGVQIWIKPTDVVKATKGEVKNFSREKH